MPADIHPPFSLESITFDAAGLVPVIAQDTRTGEVLMLAHANREALALTLETRKGTYYSRSRARLWVKGEESGHTQLVTAVTLDCDGDAVLYSVEQTGAACHTGERTCFHNPLLGDAPTSGSAIGTTLDALYATILERFTSDDAGSYVKKLHDAGIDRVLKKIGEEAGEVIIAAKNGARAEVQLEVADLLFHTLIACGEIGVTPADLAVELQGRIGKRRAPTG
jgi:phosphoribosyl-ATP pyrophosphohydrolase/phosphoribosyl-AMP cyclohydrolase